MVTHATKFWQDCDRYHDLAEEYERNIEEYHPGSVTSQRMCVCLDYCSYCGWAASKVTYYRHNGPNF